MYHLKIKDRDFRYLVGAVAVAIITPSQKVHIVPLSEIPLPGATRGGTGTADDRLSPHAIAEYILLHKLK